MCSIPKLISKGGDKRLFKKTTTDNVQNADSGSWRATTPLGSDAGADPSRETLPLAADAEPRREITLLVAGNAAVVIPGNETSSLEADNRIREHEVNERQCRSDAEHEGFEYIAEHTEGSISLNVESAGGGPTEGTRAFAAATRESRDSGFMDCDSDADSCQLSLESGRGVCVVRGTGGDADGEQWELDEAALSALLQRPGVAACPVVLVSVAGAFRSGKSFLLDICLRYLYAKESARADGSWLGAPDEPLRGFSWRGGCRRETTGLVLWSQPFPVTLPDGEKVVVLLMDTQGSFDDNSSMRDCSLIFALSTLLSSVQVYNLSQRINESDLQFLQLFTEHAAAGGGALPALQLLVRDWSAPGDFPYGAAGGDDYLRHKLQVHAKQPSELREVRERLARSFEHVECFLLPHPGLAAATDPAFTGRLADMEKEFKASLRELVPQLLAPSRLRVKAVDGRVLLARDLALHLRAYLDTFRLHVPSPQSIARAQAAARWLAAAAAARARLRAHAPARGASARGRAELQECLASARRAATADLAELAARAADEDGLANLEKDLDEQVAEYTDLNERKIELAVASAKEEWERLAHALRDPALCAPQRDLREDADNAYAAAVAHYDSIVDPEEPERTQLIEILEERTATLLRTACATSEHNHAAAESAALAVLRDALAAAATCLHPADLAATHAAAAARACSLLAARCRPARRLPDPHRASLDEQIAFILRDHERQNAEMNEQVVSEAVQQYSASMALGQRCLHRQELEEEHERAATHAADTLRRRRQGPHASDRSDVFSQHLDERLGQLYAILVDANARKNERAVEEAYRMFCAHMETGVVQLSAAEIDQKLADAADAAKEAFKNKRRTQRLLGVDDIYYNQLEQRMRAQFSQYRETNGQRITRAGLAGAIVAGVVGTAAVVSGAVVAVAAPEAFVLVVGSVARFLRPA